MTKNDPCPNLPPPLSSYPVIKSCSMTKTNQTLYTPSILSVTTMHIGIVNHLFGVTLLKLILLLFSLENEICNMPNIMVDSGTYVFRFEQ